MTGGTFTKKISTFATLNTLNRHLNIVTILNPTHPPEPRPAFACQKGIPMSPQTRRAGRTVPHILSQNPVEGLSTMRTKSRLPQLLPGTPPWPTLATTAYQANAWMPALQQLMSRGVVSRKSLSGNDRTHTLWSPTDADINQPAHLPRLPRISRTIFVGRR